MNGPISITVASVFFHRWANHGEGSLSILGQRYWINLGFENWTKIVKKDFILAENQKRSSLVDCWFQRATGLGITPSGSGWENGQSILWPFFDLALLWLRTIKKHWKHCNYDSEIKFELEGVGINTIILFFSDKN